MTCGECSYFAVCSSKSVWKHIIETKVIPSQRDTDASDCPCFERKEEK